MTKNKSCLLSTNYIVKVQCVDTNDTTKFESQSSAAYVIILVNFLDFSREKRKRLKMLIGLVVRNIK